MTAPSFRPGPALVGAQTDGPSGVAAMDTTDSSGPGPSNPAPAGTTSGNGAQQQLPPSPAVRVAGAKRSADAAALPFIENQPVHMRMNVKEGSRPDTTPQSDAARAEAEAEAAKQKELEAEIARFRAEFATEVQEADQGRLWYFKIADTNRADRFAPWPRLASEVMARDDQAAYFLNARKEGCTWFWVSVYDNQGPKEKEVTHFSSALQHMEAVGAIADLNTGDYAPKVFLRANGSPLSHFPVFCTTQAASDRVMSKTSGFAYVENKVDMAFFIQRAKSWGRRVVLDLTNAPPKASEMLLGVRARFKGVIHWEDEEKKSKPTSFRYAKVPVTFSRVVMEWAPKVQVVDDSVGHWRVSFIGDTKALETWMIPAIAGSTSTHGTVAVVVPPFCKYCCSWLHEANRCTWWQVPGVLPTQRITTGHTPLEWVPVTNFDEAEKSPAKKAGKEKEAGSSRRYGPNQPR